MGGCVCKYGLLVVFYIYNNKKMLYLFVCSFLTIYISSFNVLGLLWQFNFPTFGKILSYPISAQNMVLCENKKSTSLTDHSQRCVFVWFRCVKAIYLRPVKSQYPPIWHTPEKTRRLWSGWNGWRSRRALMLKGYTAITSVQPPIF